MRHLVLALVLIATLAAGRGASAAEEPLKSEFDKLALPLIEQRYTSAILVAVIRGDEVTYISYGTTGIQGDDRPNDRTVFPIGSLTKTFTNLLLADLVNRGKVRLVDPVERYLPKEVRVPRGADRVITLENLATHTAGLPYISTNFLPADPSTPYADYTAPKLYDFLGSFQLPRRPGELFEYSNIGTGLLGHALALEEGKPYEELLRERILAPIGMDSTAMNLSAGEEARLVKLFDLDSRPVRRWQFDVLAPCGALCSTASDMVRYLKVQAGISPSPLVDAVTLTHRPRQATKFPDWRIGLGWFVNEDGTAGWHDGGTAGSYSFAAFDSRRRFAILWLSNSSLWQFSPLLERLQQIHQGKSIKPLTLRPQVKVAPAALERLEGEYRPAAGEILVVGLYEGRLFMMRKGEAGSHAFLCPASDTEFFIRQSEALTVTFTVTADGTVKGLVIHKGEEDIPAERLPPSE